MAEEVSLRERVKEPPSDRLVESYYRPAVLRAQAQVFDHEMWVHLAHALMLERQGIVACDSVAALCGTVLELAAQGPDSVPVDHRQEDLYSYVERRIVQALGPDVGGRLHTGRSRNDLNATTWRMALREQLVALLAGLARLRGTVLDLAERHAATVMPGYTHTQHAQPITFGYWLLSAADALARDHRRLSGALAHADLCPLGAGALSTTGFPLDRGLTAELLGFAAPLEIAYDAVSSRDDALEAAAAMAVLMTLLSRLATDLQAWSTWEYGFLELADRHSAVSSIMPQKKNPVALEHMKAAAGMVQGALAAALACTKNTAFADVNDAVTAVNEPVLDATSRTRRILALAEEVLAGLTLDPQRMAGAAAEGFGSATELADVIARESGLSFRMAHNIVALVVRDALEAGKRADMIRSADLDAAAGTLFGKPLGIAEAALRQALDPAENIRARTVLGGPAPGNMRDMIAARRTALAADRDAVEVVAARLAAARERSFALARALAG
ncbi:argininosuccinate lyase [Siccirubricoccus sp. G192]|uniref:argininosuccinate lyase n=1 Tax=Siccirubricoccus sp. G192 TaxID=2849651 RepID=UPI001C2B85F2|nr:argininosuccinate lyase [Siccirubricoccus sp. G192]MBV1799703.1 argininosuccinate lyase [Siccirubricoccus sp. G192]